MQEFEHKMDEKVNAINVIPSWNVIVVWIVYKKTLLDTTEETGVADPLPSAWEFLV